MKASLPFRYIINDKRNKWYVIFDYKNENGERKRKWVGTGLFLKCTKKELNKKVDEIIEKFSEDYFSGKATKSNDRISKNVKIEELLKTSESVPCKEYEFTQFLVYWLKTIKPTIAQMSYEGYCYSVSKIREYFDTQYPNLLLRELTGLHIQQFYNDKYNSGLTANTIKHYHANIHKALKYAVKMDLLQSNPSDKAELPKMKKFQANFCNAKEIEKLLNAFDGDRLELVVNIAAYYGLRRSEILGLKWDCVDFENKKIVIKRKVVSRTGNGHEEIFVDDQLKTKSSERTLPMIPHIEKMLKERKFLEKHYSYMFKGDFDREYDGFVCRDNFGKFITPNYVTQHFKIVLNNNNLRCIRFHDLRHSCASLLLANGISMKAIQDWLGHSTFNVTADFYSHLDYNSKLASAETIAKIFEARESNEMETDTTKMKALHEKEPSQNGAEDGT